MSENYLAVDLGAESCRVSAVAFDGERASLKEVHRFENGAVEILGGLYWDAVGIHRGILEALEKASTRVVSGASSAASSVGIDSWAVDFGLLDERGDLIGSPRSHRDPRTEGMVEAAGELVGRESLYRTTGIQFNRINTLYQLFAMRGSGALAGAKSLLLLPDLFAYWLTGEAATEHTNATTTQLFDQTTGDWAWEIIQTLGLTEHIFGEVVPPGTQLAPLRPEVAERAGLPKGLPLITVASHDTASAVAAVPAEGGEGEDFAYISSGTWSLVGVETEGVISTPGAMTENFTNEGGFGGRNRLLKNVMGLWILQECRREWSREGRNFSYEELQDAAAKSRPFGPIIDVDNPEFFAPGEMVSRVREYCEWTGQRPPEEIGGISRCIFESLALRYAETIRAASEVSGKGVRVVHVVGGGSRNELLCRLTADATGLPVVAGPVEATALGNGLVQAHALGEVGGLREIRQIVRASFEPARYEPAGDAGRWEEARQRLKRARRAKTQRTPKSERSGI